MAFRAAGSTPAGASFSRAATAWYKPGVPPDLARDIATLRRLIDAMERDIALSVQVLEEKRRHLATLEALQSVPKRRTLSKMEAAQLTTKQRRGRPTLTQHAFPRVLEAQSPPSNIAAWARANGFVRSTAKSWVAPKDKGGRKIPEKAALLIQQQFGLPATEETWPNGISR